MSIISEFTKTRRVFLTFYFVLGLGLSGGGSLAAVSDNISIKDGEAYINMTPEELSAYVSAAVERVGGDALSKASNQQITVTTGKDCGATICVSGTFTADGIFYSRSLKLHATAWSEAESSQPKPNMHMGGGFSYSAPNFNPDSLHPYGIPLDPVERALPEWLTQALSRQSDSSLSAPQRIEPSYTMAPTPISAPAFDASKYFPQGDPTAQAKAQHAQAAMGALFMMQSNLNLATAERDAAKHEHDVYQDVLSKLESDIKATQTKIEEQKRKNEQGAERNRKLKETLREKQNQTDQAFGEFATRVKNDLNSAQMKTLQDEINDASNKFYENINEQSGLRKLKEEQDAAQAALDTRRVKGKSCSNLDFTLPASFDIKFISGKRPDTREEAHGKIDLLRDKIITTRARIAKLDQQPLREEMVCIAEEAVDLSASYYEEDEFELGHVATRIADTLLDVAVSLTPGVGWGRDVYEAVTGVDLLSREELDIFSRSMAILGAVTAGVGSKLGKGVKVLGKLAKGEKAAEAVKSSEKIVDAAVTQWKSVEALLHTFKGNIQKTSDGIFKLKNGMHTEKGFEHFLAMSKNSGKNFPIRTVERFSAENFTSEILKQKLPNGVTRIQLPKEAWVNSKYYGKAVGDSSDGLIKGAKTLFPESFTPANIAEAAESILVQNADSAERALNGVYKGVKIRLLRDYESKKIKSIFPRWNQE